ncbi:hypothetical protein [Acetobacter ascendens]|nr:hypothetical protein [Acetobacter ascendens]
MARQPEHSLGVIWLFGFFQLSTPRPDGLEIRPTGFFMSWLWRKPGLHGI